MPLPASADRVCSAGCSRDLEAVPTPEQITAMTAVIRARWTEETHKNRAGFRKSAKPKAVPVIPVGEIIAPKNFFAE